MGTLNTAEPGPRAAKLLIGASVFEADSPGLAGSIAQAHGARQRPRCLCRPGGVEMYVSRIGERYVVKRMPETGHRHAPDCPVFEPPAGCTGLHPLLGSAIIEDPIAGVTSLRLDFPMSVQPGYSGRGRSQSVAGSVASARPRLSLRGLLHYLWDQAELTRWHPGFEGRRGWGAVRHHLLRAAEQMRACGNPLLARLYVPEPFHAAQRDQIAGRRRSAWASAIQQPGEPQELQLLIAEAKEFAPARHGFKVVIRHVPDVAFAIDEALYHALTKRFDTELGIWGSSEHAHMLVIATFGLSAAGVPKIDRLCLMPVSAQWLPVETVFEHQLVDRLVRERRAFLKVLRYDLSAHMKLASVLLTDCGDPTPKLYAESGDEERLSAGEQIHTDAPTTQPWPRNGAITASSADRSQHGSNNG